MYDFPHLNGNRLETLSDVLAITQDGGCGNFTIPAPDGEGSVLAIGLDKGLYVQIWRCRFANIAEMRLCAPLQEASRVFTLAYYLTPNAVTMTKTGDEHVPVNQLWNSTFFTDRSKVKQAVAANAWLQYVAIYFTDQWLALQTGHMPENQKQFIAKITSPPEAIFFLETPDVMEKRMIDDIFNHKDVHHSESLFLKSRVVTLIQQFIQKAAARQSLSLPSHNNTYEPIIRQVAARLEENVMSKLPALNEICIEFAISESTLKRNFKRIFGKSIYEYFLVKKMEYARKLISEETRPITEIAYMLGYENASKFISMFKKQQGLLPSTLRKKVI